jgi:hypothetical protein
MAIICLKNNSYYHKQDKNYRCDLCGRCFKYKHDAKLHHKNRHVSDKFILSNLEGRWYKQLGNDKFMHIDFVDYKKNKVFITVVKLFNYEIFYTSVSLNSEYKTLEWFKANILQDITQWAVVDSREVLDFITKYTDLIKGIIQVGE